MSRITYLLLLIGFQLDMKFDGLRILFEKVLGFFRDFPVYPSIQMFDYPNGNGLLFMISQHDFE